MEVGGIPLHPLIVHLVVVLVPLASIGMIISVISMAWSRRYASISVAIAFVATLSAFLARQSGEELSATVRVSAAHITAGDVLPLFIGVFFVISLVFWLFDRGVPLNRRRPLWLKAFGALVVVSAVAATYQTIITGHSGALSVWG